jgi:signal transduction histidine kinase
MQTLAIKKTLGLLGMKERTLMMGGRFEINSKPGEGTTIIVTTPLQADDIAKSKTDQ